MGGNFLAGKLPWDNLPGVHSSGEGGGDGGGGNFLGDKFPEDFFVGDIFWTQLMT